MIIRFQFKCGDVLMSWRQLTWISCFLNLFLFSTASIAAHSGTNECAPLFHSKAKSSKEQQKAIESAYTRLEEAIRNPEYMLSHWIDLPTSPDASHLKTQHLSLREAILLALRYNPNIQNAELDRIIQRYQLRVAYNEFEMQYALAGQASIERSHFEDVGSTSRSTYLLTPELNFKTKFGGEMSLNMNNNIAPQGDYNPLLRFSVRQPLLRGFGKAVNEAGLLSAIDTEWLNKLSLKQAAADQITQVIIAYRALILSGNNLQSQRRQLEEAKKSYVINEKKIAAGQLEPTANIQQSYQVESLNLMVEQAENDFKTSAQDLLQTIGLDPNMKLAVPSDVTLKEVIVPDVEQSMAIALKQNTQYLALKMAFRADQRAYTVAKNQQLWQLDASANIQSGTVSDVESSGIVNKLFNGRNMTESAGLTLTIPIQDLNRRNQLISAKVKLEKDRVNLLAAKRALMTTIKNTIITIKSQARRYELAKRQVKLAEQSYELEKKKQQAGIVSTLEVNNTQNQLLQAQMGLISAKIAYLNQLSTLHRILGTTLNDWDIQFRCGE